MLVYLINYLIKYKSKYGLTKFKEFKLKIEINSKNYNVSEKLREIITKKIEKLDRYFFDDASAHVLCKYENEQYKMEITIRDRRTTFRSEVSGDNMYENIDHALPKVERQIYKNKDKLKDRIRANSFDSKEILLASITDRLGIILSFLRGSDVPESILDKMIGNVPEKEYMVFNSIDEFEKERKRILGGDTTCHQDP